MMDCKHATALASHRLDHPLSLGQGVGLRLHLFICRHCRRYLKQLGFLHRNAEQLNAHIEADDSQTLSDTGRNRIKETLDQKR